MKKDGKKRLGIGKRQRKHINIAVLLTVVILICATNVWLRSTLLSLFAAAEKGALHVNVLSFGFKNGLPPEADLVLDVRFLPNPYYVPELKTLNGLDAPVRDYVLRSEQTAEFLRRLMPLVEFLLPQYRQEGRTELVIAVGCTGGRHRSVAVARYLAEFAAHLGYPVTESHRDMNR